MRRLVRIDRRVFGGSGTGTGRCRVGGCRRRGGRAGLNQDFGDDGGEGRGAQGTIFGDGTEYAGDVGREGIDHFTGADAEGAAISERGTRTRAEALFVQRLAVA